MQFKEIFDLGFIRPNIFPWGEPIIFVRKKHGSLHLCIDYRDLSMPRVKNRDPIPRINDLFNEMKGPTFFSVIGLAIRLPPT